MDCSCTHIPYRDTGYFSSIVADYLNGADALSPFYQYKPDATGIEQAINDRENFPVNRSLLVDTLTKQYAPIEHSEAVKNNIALLGKENTFTITTAHQPNLATGYLYFIYKIAHVVKLANELNEIHKDKHFVPVFYIGSEDNDIEELGTFRYGGKKFVWDGGGQSGAVGRMKTTRLKPLLKELFALLGPPGAYTDGLKEILHEAYEKHDTIGAATLYLVNKLFGEYGLVVLEPDNATFKSAIADIMLNDLEHHTANGIVSATVTRLSEQYSSQAYPRDINLFYLADGVRERIEKKEDKWVVLNTTISFTHDELKTELEQHPERFSPNVILRGILQESILPDVVFIGGGAEVAYWLQLKDLFHHYRVFYPVVMLRQSVLWISGQVDLLRKKAGVPVTDIFTPTLQLQTQMLEANGADGWKNDADKEEMNRLLQEVRSRAIQVDRTLDNAANAVLAKILYQLNVLEKKMLRAEKRKHDVDLARVEKLKQILFPNNSLQERVENFMEYYTLYGHDFIRIIIECILPFKSEILVINERDILNN